MKKLFIAGLMLIGLGTSCAAEHTKPSCKDSFLLNKKGPFVFSYVDVEYNPWVLEAVFNNLKKELILGITYKRFSDLVLEAERVMVGALRVNKKVIIEWFSGVSLPIDPCDLDILFNDITQLQALVGLIK